MSAEQFVSQQVFVFCPCVGWSASVHFQQLLYLIKSVPIHDGRNAAFHPHKILVSVNANIFFVLEQLCQTVFRERLFSSCANALFVQMCDNFGDGEAFRIHVKNFLNDGRSLRVDGKALIAVNDISQRACAANAAAFFGAFELSTQYVLRKLDGVVFCHALQYAFQDDCFRRIRQIFCNILNTHTVSLAGMFIERNLFAIASETVNLPNDNNRKLLFSRIG